jgi:molybdenum cofactor biosynthesis protein MoaC
MVDVTNKQETLREAVAKARIRMSPQTVSLVETNQISKGSVLEVAKIAAIMVAKQTPQLIPLCHPLPMTHIDVQFSLDSTEGLIHIETRTRTTCKTGVEVEAGTLWINDPLTDNDAGPFGGFKMSGMGRELGEEGLDEFRETKHVHWDFEGAMKPWWFPYGKK